MKIALSCFAAFAAFLFVLPAQAKDVNSGSWSSAREWKGSYVGGQVGGTSADFNNVPGVIGPTGDSGGVSGGVYGGYNWQCGKWVFGAEGDHSHMDIDASSATSGFEENWNMTFRGRGGYAVGMFLPYITAGLAITEITAKSGGSEESTVVAGAAAGAGLEALASEHWVARVEYLYTEVPQTSQSVGGATVTGGSDNHSFRAGVAYKF